MGVIDLILEGFAKREVYMGKGGIDLAVMGNEIRNTFKELTSGIDEESVKKIRFILIKYMIWRLGKHLHRETRENLLRKFGSDINYNFKVKVFSDIGDIAHEIIHEILHFRSVDYFVKQNLNDVDRDLELEYIYDFFEAIAQVFDFEKDWANNDEELWQRFKMKMREHLGNWLVKNYFFYEDDFDFEYRRFADAFRKLDMDSWRNPIFYKFNEIYLRPYVLPLIESEEFKEELKGRLSEINISYRGRQKNRTSVLIELGFYDFICDRVFSKLDEAFKDRFLISVAILSRIKDVVSDFMEIALAREKIISHIKRRVLEMNKGK